MLSPNALAERLKAMANQDVQALIDTITALLRESGDNVGNFEVTQSPEGEIRVEVWLEKPVTVNDSIKKQIAAPEKTALEYFVQNVNGRVPLASISYAVNAPYFTIINSGLSDWQSMQETVREMIAKANISHIDAYADFHEDNHSFTFYPINHNEVEKSLSPIIAYRLEN